MLTAFTRGQKARLAELTPATELTVGLDVRAPGSPVFDFTCLGVDEQGKLSDDRYFVFYNHQQSPEGGIRLLGTQGGDRETFWVDLERLPRKIQKLVFAVTLDGEGTMSQVQSGHLWLSAGGAEVARFPFSGADFARETTVLVGEVYYKGEWRFAAVGQGFDGGLPALLRYFGGAEIAEEVSEPVGSPPAQVPPRAQDTPRPTDTSRRRMGLGTSGWEPAVRSRLEAAVERYSRPLADLHERDANEGDTRLLVTEFLCDGLGFDRFEDLTTEYRISGKYVDYGLRIDQKLAALIEVKRVAMKLAARHLLQAQSYALNKGVEWVLLTNGARWQAYRVTASMPVEVDLVVDVDLLGAEPPSEKAEQLFYLTRESLGRRQIVGLWELKRATSPKSLAGVLLSETVVSEVRKELGRRTGHRVDPGEIERLLRETVVRPDCFG